MIRYRLISAIVFALLSAQLAARPDGIEPSAKTVLSTTSLAETAGGLALVLLLILGLAWLARRFGRLPGLVRGPIQVVGGVSLGPREKAILLSVHGVHLLVGIAPGNIRTLHVIGPDAPHADVDQTVTNEFGQTLARTANPAGKS